MFWQVINKFWQLLILSVFCLPFVSGAYAASPQARQALSEDRTLNYATGSVLLKFKPLAQRQQKQQAYDAIGGKKIRGYAMVRGLEHIQLGKGVSPEQAVERLQRLPFVEYVEPDYVRRPNLSDTFYGLQWGLNNTGQDIRGTLGTPEADIDAEAAWAHETGNPDFVVAVIDTGVDYTHPDLAANIWSNPGETAGNGIDDDGNGYIDDIYGYDFYSNDADPIDVASQQVGGGHGTHVAGTICAVSDNGVGVAGVAHNCQIMALRFLGPQGGYTSDAISALNYAVNKNVSVSNNSWGGGGFSQGLYDAIESAGTNGHLFVAAAGNDSINTDISAHYPSSYDLDNLISVAATDNRDQLSSFSNYGAVSVDVGAPGTNIASTYPGNSYVWMGGTSMAAPHVTGLVALIGSSNPTWTSQQVRSRIFDSVRPISALAGITSTGGIINAYDALYVPDTAPLAPTSLTAAAASASKIDLLWTDNAADEDSFKIDRSPNGNAPWTEIATVGANVTGFADDQLEPETLYYYRVRAFNGSGYSDYTNVASATTEPTPNEQMVVASAETFGSGTVEGTYVDTHVVDNVVQMITERLSGGKRPRRYSFLQHTWTFEVPPGITTLYIGATSSPSADGDDFVFSYSVNGSTPFVEMADPGEFPNDATGTVKIRIEDTDRTPGNQALDTISVDYIAIASSLLAGPLPIAPDSLSAVASSSNQIDLTWRDNSNDELGFKIERQEVGGSWAEVASVAADVVGYNDAAVSPSTAYEYRVRAYNGSGFSDYSVIAVATTDDPSGITLDASGSKLKGWQTVELTWDVSGVDIYRDDLRLELNWTELTYTDADIAKGGAVYTYKVCFTGSDQNVQDNCGEAQVVF